MRQYFKRNNIHCQKWHRIIHFPFFKHSIFLSLCTISRSASSSSYFPLYHLLAPYQYPYFWSAINWNLKLRWSCSILRSSWSKSFWLMQCTSMTDQLRYEKESNLICIWTRLTSSSNLSLRKVFSWCDNEIDITSKSFLPVTLSLSMPSISKL